MALFQTDVNTPPGSAWQPRSANMGMVMEAQPTIQAMSLEEEYAEIMGNLLSDEMDAKGAVLALESLCMRKADQLSWEATQMTHRPMRSMHLDNLAHELRTQAATWHLVWCLYCNDQSPSGTGGPEVVEAGGRMTSSQLLADRISTDATLSRCASVVTWLESLAEDALEVEGAPRLAKHEGVWLETKQCLGASGVVTELDPDAPGRQAKALHVDNTEAEQRLLARCWQLVRAGRHREARALCRDCGQPWRAASIGGPTGEWGPLPVGPAAIQQDEELTRMLHEDKAQPLQAEEMAAEVELGGPAAPRALWKWTCLQVALQAAAEALPGGQYEAALYGILASHLPSVLPICTTWRDQCWAYCRTWLEQAADKGLAEAHAEHMDMATTHMMSGEEVIVDVVCKWSLHGSSKGKSVAQAALAACRGDFQAASRREGAFATASHAVGVESFEDVFEALRGSAVHAVSTEAEDPVCQAQQLMIQNDMPGLSQHLYTWLVNGGFEAGGGVMGEDDAGLGLPPRGARCLAFGCHLLLALEALGVLHCVGDKLAATQVDRLSEQVVSAYVSGLMDRGHYQLVPQYLCHVGPTYRGLLAQEALTALTYKLLEQGPEQTLNTQADQRALHVFCALDRWFGVCLRRQQLQPDQLQRERLQHQQGMDADDMGQEGVQLPRSCLRTSIRPEETRQLLAAFMQSVSLAGAAGGRAGEGGEAGPGAVSSQAEDLGSSPLGRVIAARWLQYPYVAYQQQREQRQAILQDDTLLPGGDVVWLDGLRVAVTLCEELALGDGHAVAAAWHLLDHIVPPGFQDAAAECLDAVQHKAGVMRAQAAAATDQGEFDAAMIDAECAAECAAKLQGLLQELRCWRLYCRAARAEAGWQRDVAAMQQSVGPRGDQERVRLLEAGRRAMDMLQQNILSQPWMAGFTTPSQAPPCDVAPTITLIVTASDLDPNDPAAAVDGSAISLAAAAQPPVRHAYPVLKGAALASAEQRVRVALESEYEALLALKGADRQLINISVTSPPAAEGHLTVTLTASTENAQVVQALLRLSCGLIQGDLPGLNQPMLLVNLLAPHTYRTAICMHCCLAKAVLMCARLRYGVSVTGDDGSTGEWLALALASEPVHKDVASGQQLFNVLSPAQLEEVLQLEAEGAVQLMAHAQAARAQR